MCCRLEASKTTATVAELQESGDTASEAGVSITTSSMKTLLAFQRLLISTTFFFFFFFNGSAENSQKKSPLIGGGWSIKIFNRYRDKTCLLYLRGINLVSTGIRSILGTSVDVMIDDFTIHVTRWRRRNLNDFGGEG